MHSSAASCSWHEDEWFGISGTRILESTRLYVGRQVPAPGNCWDITDGFVPFAGILPRSSGCAAGESFRVLCSKAAFLGHRLAKITFLQRCFRILRCQSSRSCTTSSGRAEQARTAGSRGGRRWQLGTVRESKLTTDTVCRAHRQP